MSPRVTVRGKVTPCSGEAEAKASAKCANKSRAVDQKLSELPMARLNLMEQEGEGRTIAR